ncbi:ATP-binding cassette domain-containing protein [Geoglobus acetivorans]
MIEVRNLWFSYGDRDVLKGIDMVAEKGEVTILMGRNGAGKSTLLMHLNGLLRPDRGEIYVDGVEVKYDRKSLVALRKKIGFVFQNPDDQIVAPTVWQDVVFGPENVGIRDDGKIMSILKKLGLGGYENRLCSRLSGGEKKRVTIAGVLAMEPDYVVMDEPTAGVDGLGLKEIIEIVLEMKKEGRGLIISTHDYDFARAVGDRFLIMNEGRVIFDDVYIDHSIAERCGVRTWYNGGEVVIVPDNSCLPDPDEFDFVAVMGKSAREWLEREGVEPDITSAAMERAFLRAIGGSRIMLVCSESMIDVVKREAVNYPVKVTVQKTEVVRV